MKIGIVVHSKTGNTLSVVQKIKEKLDNKGYEVDLLKLKVVKKGDKEILESTPDISSYEGLIFGSSVEAFQLNSVMKRYLTDIGNVSGKKVSIVITQHFKFKWLGGSNAVKKADKILRGKGAKIMGSFIVNWSSAEKQNQIEDGVKKISMAY